MRSKICGVYRIVAPSTKFYIGSAVDIMSRWSAHRCVLKQGVHHSKSLQDAYAKYGEELRLEIILECSADVRKLEEQRLIDELKPAYNATRTVRGGLSPEGSQAARSKMIELNKRPWSDKRRAEAAERGRRNCNLKRPPWSDERRAAQSERMRERHLSGEMRKWRPNSSKTS